MGYVSIDTAVITDPRIFTASNNPNFVQFESKPATKTYLELNLTVNVTQSTSGSLPTLTLLRITEPNMTVHEFYGTTVVSGVGGNVFYISPERSDTAENIRECLLNDKWFNANFQVIIPFVWSGGTPQNGTVLNIKSKGAGNDYNATIVAPNNTGNAAYTFNWVNTTSRNRDSISGEASTAEIDLDLYLDPDVFPGQDDRPITPAKVGTYVTTLKKTYSGSPLWFELNTLFAQNASPARPPEAVGWFDPKTSHTYRFTAKVRDVNSYYFYQSNALFVIDGFGPNAVDLSGYVYNDNTIKLLTNKPVTNYIRGQKEYLNFLFSDPQRGASAPVNYTLKVIYRAYSTSDAYLGTIYGQEQGRALFSIVNTCVLNIDAVLDAYPKAGIVRVALARGNAIVSNDLEYRVLPECLHIDRAFSFMNALGGWDAFNFDANIEDSIKPKPETYNRTVTPSYKRGDSKETVYNVELTDTLTIEGAPISDDIAEWLKELAGSTTVLDNSGNYIIIDDFTLRTSSDNKNMHRPTIKCHLSK